MDDATFNRKKAEQAQELARLVADIEQWTKEHVVRSDDANNVYRNLELLRAVVTDDPVESQAALAGFKTCWYMLFNDANEHCRKRDILNQNPASARKVTEEKVNGELMRLHIQHPSWKKQRLQKEAASILDITYDHLRRTYKYNPITD
jgi:hypothetical protein